MARVTVEDCLKHCHDQFALVHLASARFRQLHKGARPLVDAPKNKLAVIALREIAAGQVVFRENIDETVMASKGKLVSERMRARAQSPDEE